MTLDRAGQDGKSLTCPVCGATDRQKHVIPKFVWAEHGHAWCRVCGATYDDNAQVIQGIFAYGSIDPAAITDETTYRTLFVETSDITGGQGTVYPKFLWNNNAKMQASIVQDCANAVSKYLPSGPIRILDLGCGNGFTTRGLGRIFGTASVVGVDPSPTVLQLTADPAIECYQGTLDRIGFADSSFDAVAIIGNLMLHPQPAQTMAAVHRILKPGGIVVFDVKNIRSFTRQVAIRCCSVSSILAKNRLVQRNFVNMRFGLHRDHYRWLCPLENFMLLETRTKPPRLLAYANKSNFTSGLKGKVWGIANRLDRWRDEQSWLQFVARKL